MGTKVEQFIECLSKRGRIVMLGGLAVIAHGLARSTKDADIWLEPFSNEEEWSKVLENVLTGFQGIQPYDLRERRAIKRLEIENVVARDGVIRITGLDRPLDVFRIPHNFETKDFDEIWERAIVGISPIRVPDEIDLLISKEQTSRPQDIADISFLEEKARRRLCRVLTTCSYDKAASMFKRYTDHVTCRAALQNTDSKVCDLALGLLKQLAQSGDPFSVEILKEYSDHH